MQIPKLEQLWQELVLSLDTNWQNQPIPGAPKQFYDPGSTTKYALKSQQTPLIVQLQNICPITSFATESASANRNVAIFKKNQLWLFASSWLFAPNTSKLYNDYTKLAQASLGSILFADNWCRGGFSYLEHSMVFARRSCFGCDSHRILLLEFFLKPGIYDAKYHCAQTKLKMAHE